MRVIRVERDLNPRVELVFDGLFALFFCEEFLESHRIDRFDIPFENLIASVALGLEQVNQIHDFLLSESQVVNIVLKLVKLLLHLNVLTLNLVELSRLGQVHVYGFKVAQLTRRSFLWEGRGHRR